MRRIACLGIEMNLCCFHRSEFISAFGPVTQNPEIESECLSMIAHGLDSQQAIARGETILVDVNRAFDPHR